MLSCIFADLILSPTALLTHHINLPPLAPTLQLLSVGNASYVAAIAAGVVISVGGLTESVVKHASGALITWCQDQVRDQFDCDGLCVCCVVVCVCV